MQSLADVYDAYLVNMEITKDRNPMRLFCSDVGKCPRQVALRLTQAERKPITPTQRAMWDLAAYIEETLMKALDVCGLLLEYQAPIRISDHENWGGRLDIVRQHNGGVQIIEVKTVRSNAFNFNDRPKLDHVMQATIYDHYYDYEQWAPLEPLPPVLWYADRGGSNPPEEYPITPDFAPIKILMDDLDGVRAALPELPPMLAKTLKETNYKKVLKSVPDWRCSYCDYASVSCSPDLSEETWGELSGGWHFKDKADLDTISQWAQKNAHEAILSSL